jgi:hypothetical protein
MLDSGSSLININIIKRLGLPYTVETTEERCLMANGESCVITEAVILGIKVNSFLWKYRFLVLDYCLIPCILGVDFLAFAKVRIDFAACRYTFLFQPESLNFGLSTSVAVFLKNFRVPTMCLVVLCVFAGRAG